MLLAIQFLHPVFLYGLLLLAIPIIIHLFSFKKYKKVYFSNFNFLASLQQQKKNSSKLKNILLLLLRLAALAAIVIAFATPYIASDNLKKQSGQKSDVVIYVDNSFSMSNTGTKGSLLEEAKKYLFDIVNTYPAGTGFILLTNDEINATTLTKEQTANMLSGLKVTPASKTISEIFKETKEITQGKATTLFMISDFQKRNCDFQSISPDSLPETVFLVLKPENTSNLYIKEVTFPQAFHKKNQTDKAIITIVNSTPKEFNNVPLSLTLNDKKKSVTKINIPANSEQKAEISYLNTEDGLYRGIAEISDFPIVFDNKFFFSYAIESNVRILCIEQDGHTPYFKKLFSDSTAFDFTYAHVNQTSNINFSNYNLIILDQLNTTSTGLESALENYLLNGGNLFFLPGDKNSAATYNRMLQKIHAPQFGSADTNTVIAHIETQSSVFKDVFEQDDKNPVLPRASHFYRLENLGNAEKLLTDKKGNTVLASRTLGNGILYLSAFNYNPDNSDMVFHPLFVPTLVNMACNVNSALNTSYFLNSGQPAAIHTKANIEHSKLSVVNDDRTLEFIPEIRKDFSGNLILANTRNIRNAGLYEVIADNQTIDILAYNYNRDESQMEFSNETELQKQFPAARVENIKSTQIDRNSALVKEIVLEDNNKYLNFWFILFAVIVLLAEQFVWKKKLM